VTPPLSSSILPGVTRSTVLALCADLRIPCVEEQIPREMLYIAHEAFFAGTAVEITPLRSIDRIPVGGGSRGPITKRLQEEFFAIVSGAKTDTRNWLTPVAAPVAAAR
jgi:branched-chain amino acid aminotransferase